MNSGKKKPNLTKLFTQSETFVSKTKFKTDLIKKHEDWSLRLKIIHNEVGIINASLQNKDKEASTLNANLQELKKKHKALCKEIQKSQKSFMKKREDMQTKLLFVIDTVDSTNKILLNATKENCKKLEEDIKLMKGFLDTDNKAVEDCGASLKIVDQTLAKLLLPDNVGTCAEASKELKERLEAIINTTETLDPGHALPPPKLQEIRSSLTLLRDHCKTNVKLADLVSTNLNRVFPEAASPLDKKEDGKEERKGVDKMEDKREKLEAKAS